jgi:hypothetical protein
MDVFTQVFLASYSETAITVSSLAWFLSAVYKGKVVPVQN